MGTKKTRAGFDSVRSRKLSQRKRWQAAFGAILRPPLGQGEGFLGVLLQEEYVIIV